MATGSITSLGIGSGLDLQDILDQLKAADSLVIDQKKDQKTDYQKTINAYNGLNAKLFAIKSNALDLSLQSNFLANSSSLTDDTILDAVVADGLDESSYSIDVASKARRNSWESAGVSSADEIMFAEPESGITDTDTTAAITVLDPGELAGDVVLSSDTYLGKGSTIASGSILAAGTLLTTDIINDEGVTIAAGTTLAVATTTKGDTLLQEDMILQGTSLSPSELKAGTDIAAVADVPLSIYYGADGGQEQIISLDSSDLTLESIIDAINTSAGNTDGNGNRLVTASIATNENAEYYIRLSAANGGNTEDSKITVSGSFDWIAADTTVSIAQGTSTMYLSVAAGTTYQGMANKINNAADNPGVTAAIIDNGDASNPYQLTLTADDTGEDARITLSNLSLTEVTGAGGDSLNALFTVNGITYQRQQNSGITDVISGVTLNLKNIGETTLDIVAELDSVKENIVSLIDGFNELVAFVKGSTDESTESTNTEETEEESDNPIADTSDVNRLISRLTSLMSTVLDIDSGYSSLADIGVTIERDGTITLDEEILDQAIASDPNAITRLFIGDSESETTGLGDIINDAISDMVSSTGVVATEIDALEIKIEQLDKDIESATERLDKRYETMAAEFVRLDSYIRQLNSEASYMQSMFDSLNQKDEK